MNPDSSPIQKENHTTRPPGRSLNTNNLLINFSSQQLCDMTAASAGELFPMPNMYGSGTSQTISPANNYCFNIPSLSATILDNGEAGPLSRRSRTASSLFYFNLFGFNLLRPKKK
ncbi:hypothetical protein Ddc_15714 [Ditylenchus destructor]|nr:hypothetical protein Ddc_15714 [Ditylenchus destructor]